VRFAVLALLLAPAVALAQMYKCVDERGVTSYSDKPCRGAKDGKVDIQGQPPLSGQLRAPNENLSGQDADFRRRQIAREREAEKERAAQAKRCAPLQREYSRLTAPVRRIVQVDAKGYGTFMDDQARDKRIAELREQLRGCP
jgi:multidrug efflux pump subunit AcrA (membrane-fusion protein)